MSQTRFCQGDRVIVAPEAARPANRGVVYRVTRTLKVNVVVEPVDGGRPMRIHPDYLLPAPDDTTATAGVAVPYLAPLDPGAVVTVAGPGWKQPAGQLYVVLRDNGDDRLSIAKLGGDNGRYWRVRRAGLTVIDPARITLTPTQTRH